MHRSESGSEDSEGILFFTVPSLVCYARGMSDLGYFHPFLAIRCSSFDVLMFSLALTFCLWLFVAADSSNDEADFEQRPHTAAWEKEEASSLACVMLRSVTRGLAYYSLGIHRSVKQWRIGVPAQSFIVGLFGSYSLLIARMRRCHGSLSRF